MRKLSIFGFLTASLAAATASAKKPVVDAPTTQACLGDLATFLTCPAGAAVQGTECRAPEPHHGQAAGEHWSGSKRQGPALSLRDDNKTDPTKQRVRIAATYKDHKKTGRAFEFDAEGRLASWSDMAEDDYHGLSVTCLPNGQVSYLAYFDHGKVTGVSRSWKADGTFGGAFRYDSKGHPQRIDSTPDLERRPDGLCHPVTCNVNQKPDLSGIKPVESSMDKDNGAAIVAALGNVDRIDPESVAKRLGVKVVSIDRESRYRREYQLGSSKLFKTANVIIAGVKEWRLISLTPDPALGLRLADLAPGLQDAPYEPRPWIQHEVMGVEHRFRVRAGELVVRVSKADEVVEIMVTTNTSVDPSSQSLRVRAINSRPATRRVPS